MTEPAAASIALVDVPTLPLDALRRVAELLATCEQLPPAAILTDPPTHRSP